MQNKPLFILQLLFTVSLLFITCKKGDTGPEGPQGPQGPNGDSATSNIIYSSWLDVTYKADTIHIGDIIDTAGFYADITAAKLSGAVVSEGEVKVYMNLGTAASPSAAPLPYYDVYTGISVKPEFQTQKILLYANINASTITVSGSKRLQYRYILIPGSVLARQSTQLNWNDYNQVKAYYHLID